MTPFLETERLVLRQFKSGADADWSASSQVWSDMDTTTTVTRYDVSYDSSWSASSADTSWSASSYDTASDAGH